MKIRLAAAALVLVAGSASFAQTTKEPKPATPSKPVATQPAQPANNTKSAQPGKDHAMPPGMTEQQMKDMQVCMEAGKPGSEHTTDARSAKAAEQTTRARLASQSRWAAQARLWIGLARITAPIRTVSH